MATRLRACSSATTTTRSASCSATIVANDHGLRVAGEAADGDEAIVEAIALQPDVILLDLAMPKRSGLEALPELRRVAPDARIVVLSGFESANVAEEVLALGAASYVEKGADADAIVAAIGKRSRLRA